MGRQTVGFAARSQKPKSKGKAGSEMEGHSMGLGMKRCQRTPTGYLSMICSLPRPVVSEAVPPGQGPERGEMRQSLASSHLAVTLRIKLKPTKTIKVVIFI